jgi:predicted enzyme related to lactoylglutathione lyase
LAESAFSKAVKKAMAETVTASARSRWSIAPYFIVDDVVTTANFYRDKLGFRYERLWGDPPRFTMLHRDGITIMVGQPDATGHMRPNSTTDPVEGVWDAYVWVENADALYEEFKRNGVTIAREICYQPYGCRDFDVQDCNGYRLCFGHTI